MKRIILEMSELDAVALVTLGGLGMAQLRAAEDNEVISDPQIVVTNQLAVMSAFASPEGEWRLRTLVTEVFNAVNLAPGEDVVEHFRKQVAEDVEHDPHYQA